MSIIGAIRTWYELRNNSNVNLVFQTPSQAMNLWTDDKLKRLNLWEPGRPHAMDALRHLLYYKTTREGDLSYIERLRDA